MPLNPINASVLTPYGSDLVAGKAWFGGTVIGPTVTELNAAEIFDLDPRLPSQGLSPNAENIDRDFVVIPRGRFVGAVPRDMTYTGRGLLTFADGATVPPFGFSFQNILAPVQASRPVQPPSFWNNGYIEVPYLELINDVNGTLKEGDYVTAHSGLSDNLTSVAYEDIGKPVKWVEKAVYRQASAASASVSLTSANIPGIRPVIALAQNAGTYVSGGVLSFNGVLGNWVATFASAVTHVIYEFGQSPAHIAGRVYRLKQISSVQEADGWLRWVEQNWQSTYSPLVYDFPTSKVGADSNGKLDGTLGEVPQATSDYNVFKLAHGKIAPHKKIVVHIVSGAILNLEGDLTDITNTDLGLRTNTIFENFAQGEFYRIDFVKGYLYISDVVRKSDGTHLTASDVKVAYEYASKYEYGRSDISGYGLGIRGQTDGQYTGLRGTPIHLERAANDRRFSAAAGKFGALRININGGF